MNCSVVSVFTNLHCADCVCLYSTYLAGFLLREMLGTRYVPVGARFSILGTQIGSLKTPQQNPGLSICYKTLILNKFTKWYICFTTYLK